MPDQGPCTHLLITQIEWRHHGQESEEGKEGNESEEGRKEEVGFA
jgi:hypothetical protein